jgi:hypothetical protein
MRISVELHSHCTIRAIIIPEIDVRSVVVVKASLRETLHSSNKIFWVCQPISNCDVVKKEIATAAALPLLRLGEPALSFGQSIYTVLLFFLFSFSQEYYYFNEKYTDTKIYVVDSHYFSSPKNLRPVNRWNL